MNDHYPAQGRQNPAYGNLLLLFVLILLFSPMQARAGFISIQIAPQISLQQEGSLLVLRGRAALKNSGNERADAVRPLLVVGPFNWEGHPRSIEPGKVEEWEIEQEIPDPGLLPGFYPVKFKVYYDDLIGFPFSNVQLYSARYRIDEGAANVFPRFSVKLLPKRLGEGEFMVPVQVINRSSTSGDGEIHFLVPDELQVDLDRKPIAVDPGGFAFQDFRIENRKGFPGSSYAVFSFFEWEEGGVHRFASSGDSLRILATKPGQEWLFAGVVGSFLFLIAAARLFWMRKTP